MLIDIMAIIGGVGVFLIVGYLICKHYMNKDNF